MNEGGGTKVIDLTQKNPATSYGGLSYVGGKDGICPNFIETSNQYIQVNNEQPLRIASGGITIISAFSLRDYGILETPIQFRNIFAKRTGEGAQVNYEARVGQDYSTAGEHQCVMFAYRVNSTWHIYKITKAGFSLNTWYQYAVSYTYGQGASIKLYLDAKVLNATWTLGNGNALPIVDSTVVRIGDGNTGITSESNSTLFDGKIGYVYLYNRALSPSEIQSLYAEPYQFIKPQTAWQMWKAEVAGAVRRIFVVE